MADSLTPERRSWNMGQIRGKNTKPELIVQSRSKGTTYQRFQEQLSADLAKGLPLLWTMQLGVFAEKEAPRVRPGGHMRLILGFDAKRETIFYSDSWGAGHEKKSMPVAEAFAITLALSVIEPRS